MSIQPVQDVKPAIGIDLGTTFSCVAVVKNGQVHTIYNGHGNLVTPSWVSFVDNEILVGEPARIASGTNAANTVFNAKRLIGRSYDDWKKDYLAEIAHWPFVVENLNGKPFYRVTHEGKAQLYSPQQISSHVLALLKKAAEEFLQQPVTNAVISVPANFNYAQRAATEEAAKLAGLTVLRLCSEPAMAGIMYEPLKNNYDKKRLLVFDCGGGTTDVAILSISQDGTYDVLATAGDMYLGGENIVDRLVNHFLERLKEETEIDYSNDSDVIYQLKRTCEECKCQLSFAEAYTVNVSHNGSIKSWKMTRSRFNALNADIFTKMVEPVERAINFAGLNKSDIDEVLLAGGSSRIPDIQKRLETLFDGKPLRKSVNPEQAIAQGAAVMAAVLSGDTSTSLAGRQLCEVAPLSLSIETTHGFLAVVVPRGTSLPFSVTNTFMTADDDQPSVSFGVYEGERVLSTDCQAGYLGEVAVTGIPKARRGDVTILVTFEVNASGILQVTAYEPRSGQKGSLQVMSENRQRSSRTVADMIRDAENNLAEDALNRQRVAELKKFEDVVYSRKHREEDEKSSSKAILDACTEALNWVKFNEKKATVAQITERRMDFERTTKAN